MADAATWYAKNSSQVLAPNSSEEVFRVWDALAENPFLNSCRASARNLRWRYPERFPYRVIYEIDEAERADHRACRIPRG